MEYGKDVVVEILLRLEQRVEKLSRQFFLGNVVVWIVFIVTLCWLTSIEARISSKNESLRIQQYINSNKQDCTTNLNTNKNENYKDTKINIDSNLGYGRKNKENK